MIQQNNYNSSSSGIGFVGMLTIAFIVLKLLNVITWSWIWVLSPIWITVILVLGFMVLAILFVGRQDIAKMFVKLFKLIKKGINFLYITFIKKIKK